jgi:hypothetical protein
MPTNEGEGRGWKKFGVSVQKAGAGVTLKKTAQDHFMPVGIFLRTSDFH